MCLTSTRGLTSRPSSHEAELSAFAIFHENNKHRTRYTVPSAASDLVHQLASYPYPSPAQTIIVPNAAPRWLMTFGSFLARAVRSVKPRFGTTGGREAPAVVRDWDCSLRRGGARRSGGAEVVAIAVSAVVW